MPATAAPTIAPKSGTSSRGQITKLMKTPHSTPKNNAWKTKSEPKERREVRQFQPELPGEPMDGRPGGPLRNAAARQVRKHVADRFSVAHHGRKLGRIHFAPSFAKSHKRHGETVRRGSHLSIHFSAIATVGSADPH